MSAAADKFHHPLLGEKTVRLIETIVGLPDHPKKEMMMALARMEMYHSFRSPSSTPKASLIADANVAGYIKLAADVLNGVYDDDVDECRGADEKQTPLPSTIKVAPMPKEAKVCALPTFKIGASVRTTCGPTGIEVYVEGIETPFRELVTATTTGIRKRRAHEGRELRPPYVHENTADIDLLAKMELFTLGEAHRAAVFATTHGTGLHLIHP